MYWWGPQTGSISICWILQVFFLDCLGSRWIFHLQVLTLLGFFLRGPSQNAGFSSQNAGFSRVLLDLRRTVSRSEGLVKIHNGNRPPPQPGLLEGVKDCLKERRTCPNSQKDNIWVGEHKTLENITRKIGPKGQNGEENAIFLQKIASKRAKGFEKLVPHTVL